MVTVSATYVFAKYPQPYSLVVTGDFTENGVGSTGNIAPQDRPDSGCVYVDPDCTYGVCEKVGGKGGREVGKK